MDKKSTYSSEKTSEDSKIKTISFKLFFIKLKSLQKSSSDENISTKSSIDSFFKDNFLMVFSKSLFKSATI